MHNSIIIKGAREHNLKNIDVTIPRDRLVVITGLSGSGKSMFLRLCSRAPLLTIELCIRGGIIA